MPSNVLSRRAMIVSVTAGIAALAAAPRRALALTQAGAEQLVNSVVDDINQVISSGKSESAMIREFQRIFARYADVPIMARYALGADVRTASRGQVQGFTNAFENYIAAKYGRRFREFIGGRIEVRGARQIKNGWEIRSTAYLRGQSPFEVTFLVSDRSGKDLFYNMFIEGVNLLLTERSEIGAMLDQRGGNLDRLISDMNKMG